MPVNADLSRSLLFYGKNAANLWEWTGGERSVPLVEGLTAAV